MGKRHRKVPKATDVAVHIGVGGTALILQFLTVKEGDIAIAVPVHDARRLADALVSKADAAESLTSQGGGGGRH